MISGYWGEVVARQHAVPTDRPLDELTAELTGMLGSPDPRVRHEVALPVLLTWLERGVYDDLLLGLGDGIASGLQTGLGEAGTPSVFRRSLSALVLAACVDRDTEQSLLGPTPVLTWGDRVMTWLPREQDLRAHVPGQGLVHAVAHGADALGALARSRHLERLELTVVLDVVADRLLDLGPARLLGGEVDRLAEATMQVLRRDLLGLDVLEPWVNRIAAGAVPVQRSLDEDPYQGAAEAQAFLRSLHLQLALAPAPPKVRSDLLLVLIEALRGSNAPLLVAPHQAGVTHG
ncbi:MAG: DUF2785 domain-containing protein [Nocardioides sp.]|nr:DUF2785 domain-containing protein [Nocardioides sp.]